MSLKLGILEINYRSQSLRGGRRFTRTQRWIGGGGRIVGILHRSARRAIVASQTENPIAGIVAITIFTTSTTPTSVTFTVFTILGSTTTKGGIQPIDRNSWRSITRSIRPLYIWLRLFNGIDSAAADCDSIRQDSNLSSGQPDGFA